MPNSEIYVGRQPILDRNGKCTAYELLYRHQHDSLEAQFDDDVHATARVIINLVHNIGTSNMIGNKTGFINVNEKILMSDLLLSLPKSNFVFEILEYTDMSDTIVERIKELHTIGYRFALDDFCFKNINIDYFEKLFPNTDVVKIDLLVTAEDEIESIANKLKAHNVILLAEKVETNEIFERCKKAGFDLFQGYFFEKPTVVKGKKIEPAAINAIDMINILNTETDIDLISKEFSLCPDLTYNLLRYINSAQFHFQKEITSIKQILTLLGPSRLRSWLGLFLYMESESRLFHEAILNAAKFRACFMREIVILQARPELGDEAFLIGSLSLIDTYMQIDMDIILQTIRLSAPINNALVKREGYFGQLLLIAEKIEKTENLQILIQNLALKLHIDPDKIYEAYCKAANFEFSE